MKTIKRNKIILIFILAAFTLTSSAEKNDTQTRTVSAFSKISVSSGIDLFLTQGNQEQVRVEADTDVIDQIITRVEGETLKIYIKNRNNWNWGWNQVRRVYVTFDDLTDLDASAGSDVKADGPIKTDQIRIAASSGSDIEITNLKAQKVRVEASSGADADVSGETDNLSADSSSGSDIDCSNMVCKNCEASASSGSDIVVNVTESLNAHASSGGDISYTGNPRQKNIDESSGGDVTQH